MAGWRARDRLPRDRRHGRAGLADGAIVRRGARHAYGVALGGEIGPYLGVELEATGYGDFEGSATPCPIGDVCTQVVRPTDDNDIRTLTASVMPQIRLGRMDLFGRVGYYRAAIDTDTRFGGNEFIERGVVLGAGLRWDFENRPWILSTEATRFDDNLYRFTVGVGWQLELGSD